MDVRMPDGTIIKNVPEGTTQEELSRRYDKHRNKPDSDASAKPPVWFYGSSLAFPPSEAEAQKAIGMTRGIMADTAMTPFQVGAGLVDYGKELYNKLAGFSGFPKAPTERLADLASAERNKLAGRQGIEPAPYTSIVQALASGPMFGTKIPQSIAQGIGLASGLAAPEENQITQGTLGGAAAGVGATIGRLISKPVVKAGSQAKLEQTAKKEGVDMLYGTQTGQPMVKEIERRAERSVLLGGVGSSNYATKTREAIDDQMARAVWKRAGQNFDEFTPENIVSATRNVGAKLHKPFEKTKEIPFDSEQLKLAVDNAVKLVDDMSAPDPLMRAAIVVDKKITAGKIGSSELNVIMDDLRGLANKAYDDKNKVAGDAISSLIKSIRSHVIGQIPDQSGKEAYKKALTEYANLQVIKDAFVRSVESPRGNLDFSKLKAAIERSMPEGYSMGRANLADLADLGLAMKGGNVLPEGMRLLTMDPFVYTAFNNPISRYMRLNNPIPLKPSSTLLKAAGIETVVD